MERHIAIPQSHLVVVIMFPDFSDGFCLVQVLKQVGVQHCTAIAFVETFNKCILSWFFRLKRLLNSILSAPIGQF